jgi:pyruvate/2-oxoglutarate dehydrogenase complex dihydrolipoamide dehydrogenase (E3) component
MTTTRSGQDSEPDTDQSQAPQPPGDQPYDLIVLGAGSAGMAAATAGSHAGRRVLLVERNRSGGTCLWTGTLPSKCLIAAARTAQLMRTADRFAITPVEPAINFGELMRGIERRLTGLENDR